MTLADTHLPLALHSTFHSPSSLRGTPAWGTLLSATPLTSGSGLCTLDYIESIYVITSINYDPKGVSHLLMLGLEWSLVIIAAAVFRVLIA